MDEPVRRTAETLGLTYDEVESIVGSMWTGVKQMLRKPHYSGSIIFIGKHFRFELRYYRLVNQVHKMLLGDYKHNTYAVFRIRYWMAVIEQLEEAYPQRAKEWRLRKAKELGIDYDTMMFNIDSHLDQISRVEAVRVDDINEFFKLKKRPK